MFYVHPWEKTTLGSIIREDQRINGTCFFWSWMEALKNGSWNQNEHRSLIHIDSHDFYTCFVISWCWLKWNMHPRVSAGNIPETQTIIPRSHRPDRPICHDGLGVNSMTICIIFASFCHISRLRSVWKVSQAQLVLSVRWRLPTALQPCRSSKMHRKHQKGATWCHVCIGESLLQSHLRFPEIPIEICIDHRFRRTDVDGRWMLNSRLWQAGLDVWAERSSCEAQRRWVLWWDDEDSGLCSEGTLIVCIWKFSLGQSCCMLLPQPGSWWCLYIAPNMFKQMDSLFARTKTLRLSRTCSAWLWKTI